MRESAGFQPIAGDGAKILILGSLPGQRSLQQQQYYAHPRNAFWRIMRELYGVDGEYKQRCAGLIENRIALWDVLAASVRPGSLDSNIDMQTARANDFSGFISEQPRLQKIAFNGKKAEQLFTKLVPQSCCEKLVFASLPSTSPAHAAMRFDQKLAAWESGLRL